jgi:hypothetical protein
MCQAAIGPEHPEYGKWLTVAAGGEDPWVTTGFHTMAEGFRSLAAKRGSGLGALVVALILRPQGFCS